MAAAGAEPFGDGAEQQHRVGRVEGRHRAEGGLHLAGAGLVFHRAQRQAELSQVESERAGDRGDGVVGGVEVELVAGVDGGHARCLALQPEAVALVAGLVVQAPGEVPLDFQAQYGLEAECGVAVDDAAQHGPGGQRVGGAVAQVLVAEHPGGAGAAFGQHLEGDRVGHEDEVARAGDLVDADAVVAEEVDGHGVAGVEQERARAEVHAVAQHRAERVGGEGLGAGQAVRVAEDEPDEVDLVQRGLDAFGGGDAFVVPQPVVGDEGGPADAAVRGG